MKPQRREPTRDELLAMAYVDGELSDEACKEFVERLATEPALAREVTELKKLALIARRTAPPEPMDHEWRRLERDPLQRGGSRLGMGLMAVGALGGATWLAFELLRSDAPTIPKIIGFAALLGVLIYFLVTLRARLRTLPYDPYTEVER